MSSFARPWALCGGWAVDAWLGRVTREHLDVDVTLFGDDLPELFRHLEGWHFVAHDELEPMSTELWNGRLLELPGHLHARPPGEANLAALMSWVTPPAHKAAEDGLDYDFEVSDHDGGQCVLSREPWLALPAGEAFRTTPWGVPALVPEAVAFFKATAYHRNKRIKPRPHDLVDFEALLPVLDERQRTWLRQAVAQKFADHEWLPMLE